MQRDGLDRTSALDFVLQTCLTVTPLHRLHVQQLQRQQRQQHGGVSTGGHPYPAAASRVSQQLDHFFEAAPEHTEMSAETSAMLLRHLNDVGRGSSSSSDSSSSSRAGTGAAVPQSILALFALQSLIHRSSCKYAVLRAQVSPGATLLPGRAFASCPRA